MINRIELWDFESHEHTVLEDISPALNLFCGDSNAGKTSIVRALKLAAYNDFDPKSVRIGAKKCVVQVDTDKGRVKVTRGEKHNLWEVTKTGQNTQYFDKVGVNTVPDAEEVIGLNVVTLGDVQIPVNIMDQLESHFMLAGVGDKKASGSMRAQIVDEISGLSGIEGLIKDVGLDHHRYGRDIKETETQMEAVRSQLHSEEELKKEGEILDSAGKELSDHDAMVTLAVEGEELEKRANETKRDISLLDSSLRSIPDIDAATEEMKNADILLSGLKSAEVVLQAGNLAYGRLEALKNDLAKIPDTDAAMVEMSKADGLMSRVGSSQEILERGAAAADRLDVLGKTMASIPDIETAMEFVSKSTKSFQILLLASDVLNRWTAASTNMKLLEERGKTILKALEAEKEIAISQDRLDLLKASEAFAESLRVVVASIAETKRRIEQNDVELQAAEKERDALLASIKTCPLTLKPVSKECMEGVTA